MPIGRSSTEKLNREMLKLTDIANQMTYQTFTNISSTQKNKPSLHQKSDIKREAMGLKWSGKVARAGQAGRCII